jgi:hypothetical protein
MNRMHSDTRAAISDKFSDTPQGSRWTYAVVSSDDVVNELISIAREKKKIVQTFSPATIEKLGPDAFVDLADDLLSKGVVVILSCQSPEDFTLIEPYILARHKDSTIGTHGIGRLFLALQMSEETLKSLPIQQSVDIVFYT